MTQILKTKAKDLGGFEVRRVLPNAAKRMVGPFIFVDHMGPAEFAPGDGINVRPHPHIGLSTITYLMEGRMLHRDSLGTTAEIEPGDVNWMTAGRGIVHSERESVETKAQTHRINGMQCWVALPHEQAEIAPSFTHISRYNLPHRILKGVTQRVIAGEAYGLVSPLKTYSPMFYVDVLAQAGSTVERPNPQQECMVYVLTGTITIGDQAFKPNSAVILNHETEITVNENSRFLLLGGDEWPQVPHIEWNFVSFNADRIAQAKRDWQNGQFPAIPNDDLEHIPFPSKSN